MALRHSHRMKPANSSAPPASGSHTPGSPTRCGAARSGRRSCRPARTRTGTRRPRRPSRPRRRGRSATITRVTSTSVISTTGMLMAKIHRQEAVSTSWPPISGPSTVPIPPHAVHAPIARPRSAGGKVAAITASAAGVSSAPNTPCSARASDEQLDRRRQRAEERRDAEPAHAEDEHAPLAEQVAERAADQDQRAQRDAGRRSRSTAARPTRRRGPPLSTAARR